MTLEMMGHDVYMRHTGPDGKSYVQQHRCWDTALFVTSAEKAAHDVNAKEKDPAKRNAKAEQITDDQYRKERKP